MSKSGNHIIIRIPDPFDDTAKVRLAHMGLTDKSGNVRIREMIIFAGIFTGSFFDDLREFHDSVEDMVTIYETFKALHKKEDYHRMYLLMSIQYDFMRKPLPDPVWWLAGDSEAVMAFMIYFISRYEKLMIEDGYILPGEESGS